MTRRREFELAVERLTLDITDAIDRGHRVPCVAATVPVALRWTSDEPEDRKAACRACLGCPVTEACHEAGQHARWGIWGGVDRSTRLNQSASLRRANP